MPAGTFSRPPYISKHESRVFEYFYLICQRRSPIIKAAAGRGHSDILFSVIHHHHPSPSEPQHSMASFPVHNPLAQFARHIGEDSLFHGTNGGGVSMGLGPVPPLVGVRSHYSWPVLTNEELDGPTEPIPGPHKCLAWSITWFGEPSIPSVVHSKEHFGRQTAANGVSL